MVKNGLQPKIQTTKVSIKKKPKVDLIVIVKQHYYKPLI